MGASPQLYAPNVPPDGSTFFCPLLSGSRVPVPTLRCSEVVDVLSSRPSVVQFDLLEIMCGAMVGRNRHRRSSVLVCIISSMMVSIHVPDHISHKLFN